MRGPRGKTQMKGTTVLYAVIGMYVQGGGGGKGIQLEEGMWDYTKRKSATGDELKMLPLWILAAS